MRARRLRRALIDVVCGVVAPVRMSWARMLKRVFDIDVERCACGSELKFVAVIEQPEVIEKILTHLGLAAQPPPIAPARREWMFEDSEAA